jgi:hypothetical protein
MGDWMGSRAIPDRMMKRAFNLPLSPSEKPDFVFVTNTIEKYVSIVHISLNINTSKNVSYRSST